MTSMPRHDFETLLAQAGWARDLSRALVRDPDRADDLLQRVWLAALERPPRADAPVRRWLAAVMRNLVRQDLRGEARRVDRELKSARAIRSSSDDPFEEQFELQSRLLAAVRELDEPYRSTLWARYFEGAPPRAIARRDGVPVKTVKTRLARGLNELRARFDREHGGDRTSWALLLVPWIVRPHSTAALLGALLMNAKVKVVCAIVVLIGAIALTFEFAAPRAAEPTNREASAATKPSIEPPNVAPLVSVDAKSERIADVAARGEPSAKVSSASAARKPRRGRVLDLTSSPVAGVPIFVLSGRGEPQSLANTSQTPISGADGKFEVPHGLPGSAVVAQSRAWVTVFASYTMFDDDSNTESTIWVAPRRELGGLVLDRAGVPIAGAEAHVVLDDSVRRGLDKINDDAFQPPCRATTDANGHFELDGAPLCASKLVVDAIGYASTSVEPPDRAAFDLSIVLDALDRPHAIVRGTVVDANGVPVADAWVSTGGNAHRTVRDGRFEFDLEEAVTRSTYTEVEAGVAQPAPQPTTLRAVLVGFLPAEVSLPSLEDLRRPHAGFELVLDGKPLSIRGKVVDTDGNAVVGAQISASNESGFGEILDRSGSGGMSTHITIEALLRGKKNGFDVQLVRSASDGSFELDGLLPREYEIEAFDPVTLRRAASSPAMGGASDVVIRLERAKNTSHVAGRVVGRDGTPVVGVHVLLAVQWNQSGELRFGQHATTDADGRFDLGSIAPKEFSIQVNGEEVLPLIAWSPPPGAKLDELEIAVARRCHLKLELASKTSPIDGFALLDAAGAPSKMMQFDGPIGWFPQRVKIVDGASGVVTTDETAATIVLYHGDAEVQRVSVRLKPADTNLVRI